jgi:anti-sigma B factor antagonist
MAGGENGVREVRDGMLSVRVSDDGQSHTVALAGELDMANAATLTAELERVEGEGAELITIDMRELEFIDSTGIAILVAAHRRLNADHERIRVVRSRASGVQRVIDVTGLEKEIPFISLDDDRTTEA